MVTVWRVLATVFACVGAWCAARALAHEDASPRRLVIPDPPMEPVVAHVPVLAGRITSLDPEDRARTWRPGYQNTKTARDLRLVKPEPTTRS